jgi:hypothetical protein
MYTCAPSEIIAILPNFAQHLNEHMHTFGPIGDNMQILYYEKKGRHLNILERFYIRKEAATQSI